MSATSTRRSNDPESPHLVRVSSRFLVLSLLSCVLVAYAVGRTARIVLVINPQIQLLQSQHALETNRSGEVPVLKLPNPKLQAGKIVPQTTYTSKTFDTARSASLSSRWVVTEEGKQQCVDSSEESCPAQPPVPPLPTSTSSDDDEEEHLPQGQHLLVDIENVNSAFLNSEEQLAKAMLDLVNECGLTLLSYHCHGLTPMGVSCAGVLLESHVSFHTWPVEGVITLDLFTCGDESLLPLIPLIERLFSIPMAGEADPPQMVWAHKYRGFSDPKHDEVTELTDFYNFPMGRMTDYKLQIATVETDFQRVDVVDVLRPQYQSLQEYKKSLAVDGSYEATHPEFFEPDRIVFLDGVLQSRRTGDAPYHEGLVHPAMFAHDNPKRVAIIGGGEGATLREVLKHKTVEKVIMIEIDKLMVDTSREFLPAWSDCSMLEGGTGSCFEDPRVEVYYEDAFAWFIDRFHEEGKITAEPFDIVIMDALDPQVQKDFVDALYDGGPFLKSLPNAIGEKGILVAQMGEAPLMQQPAEEHSVNKNRVKFMRSLVDLGFQSIRDYEIGHGGFESPWQVTVSFKSLQTKGNWFADTALVDVKMRSRLIPTKDGTTPLRYFDGATMKLYMFPSRTSEIVFCRGSEPSKLAECQSGHGYNPQLPNVPTSDLEVRPSALGINAGRGLFTKRDIAKDSYIGLEGLVHSVYYGPSTFALMERMYNEYEDEEGGYAHDAVANFAYWYGGSFGYRGQNIVFVASTEQIFRNHGCNGTNNVGHNLEITEATADPAVIPEEILSRYSGRAVAYHPARERQVHFYSGGYPRRDIKQGEELVDNYLGMVGVDPEDWASDVKSLQAQCSGAMGDIKRLETL
eukprot:Nitzschia sp. Nitz4//scaffold42_size132992//58165//61027//NITZ4_003394-RA/size132992-augustus-gene-0.112-mRNA-1//-1//CDS//3329551703//4288//frame0